ncbi:MAG TPA: cytochrome d ubiquinol oxidase subunit II [Conexibacter sp.]|jgi:cytochrome d ubiquinol oxidase subunit II
MHLYTVPLIFALISLVFYVVLAGADFGAGFWQLFAGRGSHADEIREHAHASNAPVWEANHVWLIYLLVVVWTAYPTAFSSIVSTLSIPLFIAAIGIIFRGAAYALRSGTRTRRETRFFDTAFSVASILTPFALGTVIGGIASGRVPVGNAQGHPWSSWLNETSIMIGVLAVMLSAYLAAVYLAADATRHGHTDVSRAFHVRALGSGLVAGIVAAVGLIVIHHDIRPLFDNLTSGGGLVALIISVVAGVITLGLLLQRRYEWSRYTGALAVAAIIAAWAVAQSPQFLPGLTVHEAAAPHDTLVAVIIATIGGAIILFPSLAILFTLTLRGQLGVEHGETAAEAGAQPPSIRALAPGREGLLARVAIALFIAGFGFLTVANAGWAHAIGAPCLLLCVIVGFRAAVPIQPPEEPTGVA